MSDIALNLRLWINLLPVFLCGFNNLPAHSSEYRILKLRIVHISGNNSIVFLQTLDHQRFDQATDTELKLVEGVTVGRPDDAIIAAGLLLDLLEKQAVLLGELDPKALVMGYLLALGVPIDSVWRQPTKSPQRIEPDLQEAEGLLECAKIARLPKGYAIIKVMADNIDLPSRRISQKAASIRRLLHMLFGVATVMAASYVPPNVDGSRLRGMKHQAFMLETSSWFITAARG
jgi:hypothetical protein